MLNTASPLPLYRQLADSLTEEIRRGGFAIGERIPGEHELADRYAVGRPTVRQATEVLVRRGVLKRRRGSGTYVHRSPETVDLFSYAGTLSAFEELGTSREHRVTKDPCLHRRATSDYGVWRFQRLTRIDKKPVLLEDFELSAALFPELDRFDLNDRSLSELVLDVWRLKPIGGRQSFRAANGPHRPLTRAAIPLLIVERTLDFDLNPGAIQVLMHCRTDRFAFAHEFGVNTL